MSRSRDVSNLVTVPPSIYATDSEVASTLTGYLTPSSTSTLTNKTLTDPAINGAVLKSPEEVVTISATSQPSQGTITIDLVTSSVHYYTSAVTGNWNLEIRGDNSTTLNSILDTGASISCAILVTNGATAYYHDGLTIDGSGQGITVKWQGGSAPTSGNANSIDAYSFTIIKTNSFEYTVLASQTQFA